MFKPFSEKVFATHFRETKKKLGYESMVTNSGLQIDSNSVIPELDSAVTNSHIVQTLFDFKLNSGIQFKKCAYLTWTYTDHEKKCDFVCVAVCMMSGSRNINFNLSDDGMKLSINYVWPSALTSPNQLFSQQVADRTLTLTQPKIHILTPRLLE
ncbi:hypothetical protein Bhyg_03953 [Pseudolycoriella hygida]|uniref:Uncharacterized protein n=1 Tax=Pseudolycoriella hygida TaxID=35572 RepID=A0A9Q0NEB2_9DIPT|nr:hypothetical protein Bhyg_03953 [Pseudolycoriella hygida]